MIDIVKTYLEEEIEKKVKQGKLSVLNEIDNIIEKALTNLYIHDNAVRFLRKEIDKLKYEVEKK